LRLHTWSGLRGGATRSRAISGSNIVPKDRILVGHGGEALVGLGDPPFHRGGGDGQSKANLVDGHVLEVPE
jgi:hypothetical protein